MVFSKYIDIERIGHPDNLQLLQFPEDEIVVEEKVDGGNGCFWLEEDGSLHFGSRNRDLTHEKDEKTFKKERNALIALLEGKTLNPDYIYFIEWMARHTIKYTNAPAVIGIDIRHRRSMVPGQPGLFLSRDAREKEFERIGIPNVPVVWRGRSGDLAKMDVNALIPPSAYYEGKAEGIVLKNQSRKAPVGNHQLCGKVVAEEFKENNKAVFGSIKSREDDTQMLVEKYVTTARIRKAILRNMNENGEALSMEMMKHLYTDVLKDVFKEEIDAIMKECRLIDFGGLRKLTARHCVRELQAMMTEKATEAKVDAVDTVIFMKPDGTHETVELK